MNFRQTATLLWGNIIKGINALSIHKKEKFANNFNK